MFRILQVFLCLLMSCATTIAHAKPVFGYGVHFHSAPPRMTDGMLDKATAGGARIVRWDAPWTDVERQAGQLTIPANWDYAVSQASARGVQTILILDYGNPLYDNGGKPLSAAALDAYARYVRAVVTHFRGKVAYYEIWNEWDGSVGGAPPGDAAGYVRLVQRVAPIIRTVDPAARILGGSTNSPGLNSYRPHTLPILSEGQKTLSRMLDLGLMKSIDGLSIHPYVYNQPSDKDADAYRALLTAIVTDVRQRTSGHGFPIFVTEIGWPTVSAGPNRLSPQLQEKALVAAAQYSAAFPDVKSFIVYQLQDPVGVGSDPEKNFGVIDGAGRPKPAYITLRDHH